MLYPSEYPYIMELPVDLGEIERQVHEAFEETFGKGMVREIFANEYPGRIGVMVFLHRYEKAKASRVARTVQEGLAAQGLRVGILALPASAMKEGEVRGYSAQSVESVPAPESAVGLPGERSAPR